MSWPNNPRPAKCLTQLRLQLNTAYPNRDHESDGLIGDASHQSRNSDHNGWIVDDHGIRVVSAMDVDRDLKVGSYNEMQRVIDSICHSRDQRVKYIIFEGRITVQGSHLQNWKKYTGVNAHRHHAHISVFPEQRLYDDVSPWAIAGVPAAEVHVDGSLASGEQSYIVVAGDTLWAIARRFKTSVDAIKQLSGIASDTIRIGQVLRIK